MWIINTIWGLNGDALIKYIFLKIDETLEILQQIGISI